MLCSRGRRLVIAVVNMLVVLLVCGCGSKPLVIVVVGGVGCTLLSSESCRQACASVSYKWAGCVRLRWSVVVLRGVVLCGSCLWHCVVMAGRECGGQCVMLL